MYFPTVSRSAAETSSALAAPRAAVAARRAASSGAARHPFHQRGARGETLRRS